MRIIEINNQKGGIGETTTALNLGGWLKSESPNARKRRKKSVVDDESNSFVDWVDAAHTVTLELGIHTSAQPT